MEKTVYKSRIGKELIILFILLLLLFTGISLFEGDWQLLVIMTSVCTLFILPLKNTSYTVEGMQLKIRVGYLYKQDVDIGSIRKITESDSWVSSPAPDIKNRLDLQCGKAGSITVSPSDKQGFIQQLLQLNPGIQVLYKADKKSKN